VEEFFIISRQNIDSSWSLSDLRDDYNALEYCEQILDIPEELIEYATLGSDGLEISLLELDDSLDYDEDWYLQLRRISNYQQLAS
jgi:hypothetical protein